MTITAPMFSEVNLSDPDEQMKVTNNGTKPIEWTGIRRVYTIQPKKTEFVPFHVIVRYLGDPRSDYKKTESFKTPSGDLGVIPERRGELIRLSVLYGLYHGNIPKLPSKAPKCTVLTLNDVPITFPIHDPKGKTYGYDTTGNVNIDVRTELERLRAQNEATEGRMSALMNRLESEDPDTDEATDDSHPGM